MSSTTTAELAPTTTITLVNGQTCTFSSQPASTAETIPIIDVSRMFSDKIEDRKEVALEIREASRTVGFFNIINHGVNMTLAENVLTQAKRFFSLPLEKKMDVCTDLMPNEFCGYHPMEQYNWSSLKRKDLHEAYNWNYDPAKDPDFPDPKLPSINMWPKDMPEFEENLCAYQTRMVSLARQLTRMFALALEIPENSFDDFVRRPEAGVRILHYPEQTATADDQNGIGAHTDVEYFTIITQDSEGLEVLSKSGQWIKVQPVKNAFVVNIADCFMRQTNDFFVSTIHRVINRSGRERYSVPFFWGFNRDTLLTPVPTCVEDAGSSRYELMTAGEYYLWRTRRQKQVSATSMAN